MNNDHVEIGDTVKFNGQTYVAVMYDYGFGGIFFQRTKKDGTANKGASFQKLLEPYEIVKKAKDK